MTAMPSLTAAMAKPIAPKGVYAAVPTPLTEALEPDLPRMIDQCRTLLANGCDGLSMLGTTGEANSLSMRQRMQTLEALVKAGLPTGRMIPGTGASALGDAIEYTKQAVELGCAGALLLPPFFYKNYTDDGVFAYFARLIERVGDARLRVYFYHIPQVSAAPVPIAAIERLVAAFPGIVAGLKDSSGNWAYTQELLTRLPGFAAYTGTEQFLLRNLRAGGAGCITGSTNLTARLAAKVRAARSEAEADAAQARLNPVVDIFNDIPFVPAIKALLAEMSGDSAWSRVMPPFTPYTAAETAALVRKIDALLPRAPGGGWVM